jgi:esterase/lipase superfamily enzyme
MHREYHRWFSGSLQREMELLFFGHDGPPMLVFPTSMGAFYEFEDRGMIGALGGKLAHGQLRLACISSVDGESWYNRRAHPRHRVLRHLQYEDYILNDVVPLIRHLTWRDTIGVTGCSFGAYHAMAFALRHPYTFTWCVTMGGAFEVRRFLDGYFDEDCYFLDPTSFLPGLGDPYYLAQAPAEQVRARHRRSRHLPRRQRALRRPALGQGHPSQPARLEPLEARLARLAPDGLGVSALEGSRLWALGSRHEAGAALS